MNRERGTVVEVGVPVAGVRMECTLCGRCEVADPLMDCEWKGVYVHGEVYYFCPAEFPPEYVSRVIRVEAWKRCFEAVFARRGHYN